MLQVRLLARKKDFYEKARDAIALSGQGSFCSHGKLLLHEVPDALVVRRVITYAVSHGVLVDNFAAFQEAVGDVLKGVTGDLCGECGGL